MQSVEIWPVEMKNDLQFSSLRVADKYMHCRIALPDFLSFGKVSEITKISMN